MKNSNIRKLIALAVSYLPTNSLRCFFYKVIFGYKIKESHIGFGTMLFVKELEVSYSYIGRFNKFTGPVSVSFSEGSVMADNNQIRCGFWLTNDEILNARFDVARKANITSEHYFDVTGGISIGEEAWIAGRQSQLWTHGAGQRPKKISIGGKSYVGSAVLISPGVEIGENTTVALGSIITKRFCTSHILIGGCPAKIIRENYSWCNSK